VVEKPSALIEQLAGSTAENNGLRGRVGGGEEEGSTFGVDGALAREIGGCW
jgi:hypothetical protein